MTRKAFAIDMQKCHSFASITMKGESHPAALMENIFLKGEAVASLGPVSVRTAWIASFPVQHGESGRDTTRY